MGLRQRPALADQGRIVLGWGWEVMRLCAHPCAKPGAFGSLRSSAAVVVPIGGAGMPPWEDEGKKG